ncbi:MAG: hypothetical protein J6Q67_00920 [Clostridia bacterium]|nr:hypothetical protein [Clostridia bacterium]
MATTEKKITKREIFESIITAMNGGDWAYAPEVYVEFCEKEVAALDAKAAKAAEKAAEKRALGDALQDAVLAVLTDEFVDAGTIAANVGEFDGEEVSAPKVQYRLRQLVASNKAEQTDMSIPASEGKKARIVKGYRLAQ